MASKFNGVDSRFKCLIKEYLDNGDLVVNYGVLSFEKLLESLYPYIKDFIGYEEETLYYAIQWYLEEYIKGKDSLKKNHGKDLIEYIRRIFENNTDFHTIVFPLQKSVLNKNIKFDNFYLLKKSDENEILRKISRYSKINKKLVHDFLDHTKNSRSKDFLKFNLMLYNIKENSTKIMYNSADLYNAIVNILNIMYRSKEFINDSYTSLLLKAKMWEKSNRHVAILSKDWVRCGHTSTFEAPICDSDISFMNKKKTQEMFVKLLNLLINYTDDELIIKFRRSFSLYMEAHRQYFEYRKEDIALILYITCLESLVAENINEKKLRFSILVPALLPSIKNKHDVSLRLRDLYDSRNSFIHASKKMYFKYEDDNLGFIDCITAKFLLLLADIDSILSNYKVNSEMKCITAWNKLLDEKYDKHLFRF